MMELNQAVISQQQLGPGVAVRNKHDPLHRRWVISSIGDDGTVFFKGGNGAKAWSRSLIRIE